MPSPAPLLDLGTARAIVQKHVGKGKEVTACWQPPEPIYRTARDDDFYFAVVDRDIAHVGGTRHVAVDRRTGAIRELGRIGE